MKKVFSIFKGKSNKSLNETTKSSDNIHANNPQGTTIEAQKSANMSIDGAATTSTGKLNINNSMSVSTSNLGSPTSATSPVQTQPPPAPRINKIPSPNSKEFYDAIRDTQQVHSQFAFNKANYRFVSKLLGEGSYASVKEAVKLDENIAVAVKEISKQRMRNKEDRLKNEIEVLLKMSHPNIIHLLDWGLGRMTVYLVTELAPGGELFNHIIEVGVFYESDAITIMSYLLDAINYVHSLDIVHRDIKPENIFIKDPKRKDYSKLVIGDFGISRITEDERILKTRIGSSGYIAPEVLLGIPYGKPVDLWSLGVIAYILLTGSMPFATSPGGFDAEAEIILNSQLPHDEEIWSQLTLESRSFVESCLTINPKNRITAEKALGHPWITKFGPPRFRKDKGTQPSQKDIYDVIKEGLSSEKMRIANLINQQILQPQNENGGSSGQTSGWGTANHSRNGSVNDITSATQNTTTINQALETLAAQQQQEPQQG